MQPEPQVKAWTSWMPCRDDVCCTTPPQCLAPVSYHITASTLSIRELSARSLSSLSHPPSSLSSHRRQFAAPVVSRTPLRYHMHPTPPSIPPPSSSNHTPEQPSRRRRGVGRALSLIPLPSQPPAGNHRGGEQDHPANPIAATASSQCPPTLVCIPLAFSSHPQPKSSLLPYSLNLVLVPEQIFSVPPPCTSVPFPCTTQRRSYLPFLILS